MKESLTTICSSFIENRDIIKKTFRWENTLILSLCASEFTAKGIAPDGEKMLACRTLIKESTGVFSCFRGIVELPLITKLAACDSPEEKIRKITEIYKSLKTCFPASQHLAYAAAALSDMTDANGAEAITRRGFSIFKLMRKKHPMLTASEDSVFSLLLAFSAQNDNALIEDMEFCYRTLKPVFKYSNYVQSMSQVIALAGGDIRENCQRSIALFDELKKLRKKYNKSYELSVLAALAVLPGDICDIAADIAEIDDFLSTQKGYGFWGVSRSARLMHAAALAACDRGADTISDTAAVSATIALIAAQQAATAAVIAASISAYSASSY